MTTDIKLRVPIGRIHELAWIVEQTDPEVVADVLSLSKSMYESSKCLGSLHEKTSIHDLIQGHKTELENQRHVARHQQQELERVVRMREENEAALKMELSRVRSEQHELEQEMLKRQQELFQVHYDQVNSICANQVAQMQQQAEFEKERLVQQHQAEQARLKTQEARLHERVLEGEAAIARLHQEYSAKLEPLLTDSTAALRTFANDCRTGVVGERLVQNVFDALNVGFLEDLRHSKEPGCEDYLWTVPDAHLRCSVEVKWVERIHNQHDMQKHLVRTQEARRNNKINCGLFLSLKCQVPNMKQVELKMINGIPVLYVSGSTGVPPHTVAESGFRFLRAVWPFLARADEDAPGPQGVSDDLLAHVSELFERQFVALGGLGTEVNSMVRQCAALHRSIEKMGKMQGAMLNDIMNIQINHPRLATETPCTAAHPQTPTGSAARLLSAARAAEDAGVERLDDERHVDAVALVLEYLRQHRRYPHSTASLPAGAVPDGVDFDHVLALARRKRRREGSNEDGPRGGRKRHAPPPPVAVSMMTQCRLSAAEARPEADAPPLLCLPPVPISAPLHASSARAATGTVQHPCT